MTFSHNQNGERTQKSDSSSSPAAVTDYTYDVVGNLTRVDLPSTDYIEYLYDAFDRRSVRKVNGTVDRYYVYQSDLQIAAEYDSGFALVARYVYASQSHVPDYVVKSGVNYRIVTDQIGSVRLVVRADTGAVVQAISYDEFGRVLSDSNPGFQAFGFAGGLYDHQTSLVRFGARDYDPETGRWLSKEPILFNGGDTNLYGYVMNDPVNLVDPSGLLFEGPIANYTSIDIQRKIGRGLQTVGAAAMVGGLVKMNPIIVALGALIAYEGNKNVLKAASRTDFGFDPLSQATQSSNRGPASLMPSPQTTCPIP